MDIILVKIIDMSIEKLGKNPFLARYQTAERYKNVAKILVA